MGQHDGLGLGSNGSFNLAGVNVVCCEIHINKHRDSTELEDRIDRRRGNRLPRR